MDYDPTATWQQSPRTWGDAIRRSKRAPPVRAGTTPPDRPCCSVSQGFSPAPVFTNDA
jgi:hypothetical protein